MPGLRRELADGRTHRSGDERRGGELLLRCHLYSQHGSQFRTPFHQDAPCWPVEWFDTCSAWMPLVPVAKRSALEFVKGSHAWDVRYAQTNFGLLTGDERDQVVYDQLEDELEPFPDIEGHREHYEILS